MASDCIEWTGPLNRGGYGHLWWQGRKTYAHRVAWIEAHGEIPAGMLVCHHCDNPPCVNLDHLFLGTPADNTHDMMAKGRQRVLRGEDRPGARLTWTKVAEIRSRIAAGETQIALAHEFGITNQVVSNIWQGKKWRDPNWTPPLTKAELRIRSVPRGESHNMVKLNWDQVEFIRSQSGSVREIADQFEMSIRQVYRIRRGENWRVTS